MGQTITERREIFYALRLNENLDRLNPALNSYFGPAEPAFLQETADQAAAQPMALQPLENLREQQVSPLFLFRSVLNLHHAGNRARLHGAANETLRCPKGQHVASE
jgi:hypothetical protein